MDSAQDMPTPAGADLSTIAISLLKGVVYREEDERQWSALLALQMRVREFVSVLGLELILDDAEGYAFLRSKPQEDLADGQTGLRRLVARRPLSFPVSLMLALLRKKIAEFDASGSETRLVLSRDQIVDLVRVFLPHGSNEAKLVDQIDNYINKVVDLGFLRRLKAAGSPETYEVQRILKAFVDAQWLADFDSRLEAYRTLLKVGPEAADE